MNQMSTRAGHFAPQLGGYEAFVPKALPPGPPLVKDDEMLKLLSEADRWLGRLDGITRTLPNPDLFVDMYVKKESLLSSQIEGTQASFTDILAYAKRTPTDDQREVSNYVEALHHGLRMIADGLPLCLRLIQAIHGTLLATGRGSERSPGEFRKSQNWLGASGSTLQTAMFVPPCAQEMTEALRALEAFINAEDMQQPLIKIALIHAQFESIHPFLDGNGRVGRLLITFWLVYQKILTRPLLYLSIYFKQHRAEYYDRLMAVRLNGEWEAWVKFFLRGVASVSEDAVTAAEKILQLRAALLGKLETPSCRRHGPRLLEYLFAHPIVTRKDVAGCLGVSSPTAAEIIRTFEGLGIVVPANPTAKRNQHYKFAQYLDILEVGTA